jgi:hypothetical protein
MDKEKIIQLLNKFNYNYYLSNNTIVVKLELSHQIKIEFSESNKVIIKDKLLGWNFLTGLIEMSLKSSIIYNLIGALLFGVICVYFNFEDNYTFPIILLILYLSFAFLFTIYYLIKLENFKVQILSWLKE